jgi:hypothetical protein
VQSKHCAGSPETQGLRCGHLQHACKLFTDNQADIRQGSQDLQKQAKVRLG